MEYFFVRGVRFVRYQDPHSDRWIVCITMGDDAHGFIGSSDHYDYTYQIADNWLDQ